MSTPSPAFEAAMRRALLLRHQQQQRAAAAPTRPSPGVPLRAVKTQAFTAASPDALATAVNNWISANAQQRTMLSLTYQTAAASIGGGGTISGSNPGSWGGTFDGTSATVTYTAFLTYTE